jgi:nuclear transport factor 2 (NTF2) superfamily protein
MSYQLPPVAECTEMLDFHRSLPPSGQEVTQRKLRAAGDAWNTREPRRVLFAYTTESDRRNHAEFVPDQQELVAFLIRKWAKELGGRLMKELWAWPGAKIAIHSAFERLASAGNWIPFHRNENEKFGANGPMELRLARVSIDKPDRMMRWDRSGPRAADHSGHFHFSSRTTGELKPKRRPE